MINETKDKPTIENVLPEFKDFVSELTYAIKTPEGVSNPILKVPGGTACPWCLSEMNMIQDSYIAVCENDSGHVVVWLPWGG